MKTSRVLYDPTYTPVNYQAACLLSRSKNPDEDIAGLFNSVMSNIPPEYRLQMIKRAFTLQLQRHPIPPGTTLLTLTDVLPQPVVVDILRKTLASLHHYNARFLRVGVVRAYAYYSQSLD
jgi:hypothetical protein